MPAKDSQARPAGRPPLHIVRRRVGADVLLALCLASLLLGHGRLARGQFLIPAKGASTASGNKASAEGSKPGNQAEQKKSQIVAVVNAEEITREELGRQCLWHFGREVLEAMVNKRIIEHECKKQNINITIKEVDAEIDRMAQRFGVPTAQWLKLLESERKIKPAQYAKDIVWPTLALQRLAAHRLVVTEQDLHDAWETQYGEAIGARVIASATRAEAERIRALALKNPADFGNLAKQYSIDKSSASLKGLIQPIRKHQGNADIERAAFALQPGQISEVIAVADQFIIIQCERRYEARPVPLEGRVRELLAEAIRDKKLRLAADDILRELQSKATVDVVYNDPQRRAQNPTIAAVVNGQTITIDELADECIERHGTQILEHYVHRKIVEQACRRQNIQIAPAEIEAEIARTALDMGHMTADGKPDVAAWLKAINEAGLTKEMYVHDTVWPNVALKKLVGKNVEVTDVDLQRGFEANYGPRVRCRAIVLSSMRRAQEVWELASKNPTVEYFGELAEKYSIEASTRSLRGEIPPIQKWGGEPTLQQEAFSLKPGELSGVVQVGDNYVILLCEGYTEPKQVNFAEVRDLLYEDIFDKKQRLAMAREFDRLVQAAQIDNYITGVAQAPSKPKNRESMSLDNEISQAAAGLPGGMKSASEPARAGSILRTAAQPSGGGTRGPGTPPPAPPPSPPRTIGTRVNLPPASGS
jgi:parvulin-like peptidyl-prolyl isomerase